MNNDTADAITVLQNLSSFVGAGGLDVTDVSSLDERIRWGIDVQVSVSIQRAAQIVEDCSKVPSTRWGQVKAAILGLDTCKHPYTRTTSLAAQDGLVEALERCAQIVEQWNHRQNEKVDDIKYIVRNALSAIKGDKS